MKLPVVTVIDIAQPRWFDLIVARRGSIAALVGAGAVFLGTWLAVPVGAPAKSASSCGPTSARTVAGGSRLRVYTIDRREQKGGSEEGPSYEASLVFACLLPHGKPRLIGRATVRGPTRSFIYLKTVAVDSPWLAYEERLSGIDTRSFDLVAKDISTNEYHLCELGLTGEGNHSQPRIAVVVIAHEGTIGWAGERAAFRLPPSDYEGITPPSEGPGAYERDVGACIATEPRKHGEGLRIFDIGEGIDLNSLALHRSMLIWTDAGETRTAVLP
jgi:hypothetical protein